MRLETLRHSIRIVPETIEDEILLEDVYGFKEKGDSLTLTRIDALGSNQLGWLKFHPPEQDGA